MEPKLLTVEAQKSDSPVNAPAKPGRVVPKGYIKLEAGTLRRIRVNREWITTGRGKPFIVSTFIGSRPRASGFDHFQYMLGRPAFHIEDVFRDEFFSDVIAVDGMVYLKAEEVVGCGDSTRSAWVETSDELLVKR